MHQCVRKLHFCAGHRVMGHENKCGHLHGHNYIVYVHARAVDQLDAVGRVVDFSVIKQLVGEWVDTALDHGFILHKDDPALSLITSAPASDGSPQKVFTMEDNPTAENIAHLIWRNSQTLLSVHGVVVDKLTVWETENCYAEYVPDGQGADA